jgi:hypothetical protein
MSDYDDEFLKTLKANLNSFLNSKHSTNTRQDNTSKIEEKRKAFKRQPQLSESPYIDDIRQVTKSRPVSAASRRPIAYSQYSSTTDTEFSRNLKNSINDLQLRIPRSSRSSRNQSMHIDPVSTASLRQTDYLLRSRSNAPKLREYLPEKYGSQPWENLGRRGTNDIPDPPKDLNELFRSMRTGTYSRIGGKATSNKRTKKPKKSITTKSQPKKKTTKRKTTKK